jgi:hypothetical protein
MLRLYYNYFIIIYRSQPVPVPDKSQCGIFPCSVDKFFRGTPPVYDERHENKAVNHQALWYYWLKEVNPGGCVYSLPRTRPKLTLLQDGGA